MYERARQGKKERFTALLHHVTVDLLQTSYLKLKRDAAPGVDGTTWREYGQAKVSTLKETFTANKAETLC
jgi:hypothetical protein